MRSYALVTAFFCICAVSSSSIMAQTNVPTAMTVIGTAVMKPTVNYHFAEEGKAVVVVTDEQGKPVLDLAKNNFAVTRGLKKATITRVTPLKSIESTKMRVILAVDNSSSMSERVEALLRDIDVLLKSLSKASRIAVVVFDESTEPSPAKPFTFEDRPLKIRRQPFTENRNEISSYLKYMLAGSNLTNSTYLFDEVYSAAAVLKSDTGEYDKTFVIVLSDGQDISSKASAEDAITAVRGTVPFYTIDYITEENEFMKRLARETGGTHYRAERVEGLRSIFESIAEKVVDKGYEVEFVFKASPRASVSSSNSSVTVKEEAVRETFPLLNYVFFDQGKPEPLARYEMFAHPLQTETFDEASIPGGALDHYLDILNIIGSRLLSYPEASITLTGYHNKYKEEAKAGKKLSRERAEIVKSYLVNTWRVLADSIKIKVGDLPKKPSDVKTNEGREENRRVEIESSSYDILKPVTFKQRVKYMSPPENRFILDFNTEEGMRRWQLNVAQGHQVATFTGTSTVKSVAWDWQCKDKPGNLPDIGVPLTYTLKVDDNAGDTYSTPVQTINVEREQVELQKVDTLEGGVAREKVSLILFEFNSADPGPKNDRILEDYVYGRVTDSSSISVFGFTDIIGDSLYNQKLSDKRAKAVYDKLVSRLQPTIPQERITYVGYGEAKPIFSNEIPEGRFYNRTVQLEITNPKP